MSVMLKIDEVARQMAGMMDERWEEIDQSRQQRWRSLAWITVSENVIRNYETAEDVADQLEGAVVSGNCYRKDMSGMLLAAQLIRREIGLAVEEGFWGEMSDTVPVDLDKDDPHAALVGGDLDPYVSIDVDVERCAETHEDGWECTRPVHSPTWQHWDADPEMSSPAAIQVTWGEDDQSLISIHPNLISEDD